MALALAALPGCNCGNDPGGEKALPFALEVVSGAGQTAPAGEVLPESLVVRVVDEAGQGVVAHAVLFELVSAPEGAKGQALSWAATLTGEDGLAPVDLTLGSEAGEYVVRATAAGGLAGSPATFTATAEAEPPSLLSAVSGDGQTGVVAGALAEPMVVRLLDEAGSPVAGARIGFALRSAPAQATVARLDDADAVTDADGYAATSLTLGTRAGSYQVGATVVGDPGAGEVVFEAAAMAGEAFALTVAAGDGQTGVVEGALDDALVAQVVDEHGNPVAGHRVTFALRQAPTGATGQAITVADAESDAAGLTATLLTLGTRAGTYFVDAAADPELSGSPATFAATARAGETAALELVSGEGQRAAVRTALPRPLLVRAVDRHGNVVAGQEIGFAIDAVPAGSTGEALSETVVDTGPGGLAGTSLTLGTRTGAYSVRATSAGSLTVSTATFLATATAAAPAQIVVVSGDLQEAAVTQTLSEALVVQLLDEHGNPVPDHPVGFVIGGAPAGASGQRVGLATVATDLLGTAATTLTLGDRPGVYQVASTAGTLGASFTATAAPGPGYLLERISAPTEQAAVQSAAPPLVVRVLDAQGNAAPGHPVTFAIEGAPEGATGQSLSAASVLTGADGQATSTLTLGTLAGEYTVSASAGDLFGSPVVFVMTGVPGAGFSLEKVSGDAQVAQVTLALTEPLVVRVRDAYGNPVAGHEVSFALGQVPAETTGQALAPASVLTDAEGLAGVTLTLGTRAGGYEVSATASGSLSGSPVVFTANAVGGAAVSLEQSSQAHQTAAVTEPLAPMIVRVVDAVGNGTAGYPVSFVIRSAPTRGDHGWLTLPTETDLEGRASATLALGTLAGDYEIVVTAGSLSGSPVTFTAAALPGAASEIAVEVSPALDVVPGQPLDLSLTVVDAHANTRTDWTGTLGLTLQTDPWGVAPVTVQLQASDQGSLTLPAAVAFSCAGDHLIAAVAGTLGGLSPVVSVVPGRLVDVRAQLDTYGPLESGSARFSFELGSAWPPDGALSIVLPEGYDLSSATLTGVVGADGAFSLITQDARTALVTRTGTTWLAAGSSIQVELGGVQNPAQGAEGLIEVSTQMADGRTVDTGRFYLRVWRQTSAGLYHACGVDTEGRLWCWGYGRHGRLGDGDGSVHDESLPVEVSGGHTDWLAVSAGPENTCGLRAGEGGLGATLWCWGRNYSYELGIGAGGGRTVPTEVAGQHSDWLEVSLGGQFTCGRRGTGPGGTLWCWGSGAYGRLGTGDTTTRTAPAEVSGGHGDWLGVATGGHHGCGLRASAPPGTGTMWCWGLASSGQVGHGSSAESHVPVEVAGWNTDWIAVGAGTLHSCGIRAAGTDAGGALWCWGAGANGRLGYGEVENRFVPVQAAGSHTDWLSVSPATSHTCGLRSAGAGARATAWCWGMGENGRLGNRGFVDQLTPAPVHGGATEWVDLAAGGAHTCGVRALGTGDGGILECWGSNEHGRLGLGLVHENHLLPVAMDFASGVLAISASQNSGCALNVNGTISCWGHGNTGRLGNGDLHRRTTPWTVGAGDPDWLTVAAGREHGCGLRDAPAGSGGTAWCWGREQAGRLGNGAGGYYVYVLSPVAVVGGHEDWVSIAAGSAHTCGLRASAGAPGATAWCWGEGASGRLGDGGTTDRAAPVAVQGGSDDWLAISTGGAHTCGIRASGAGEGGHLWCWGNNSSGQVGNGTLASALVPVEVSGGFDDWIAVSAAAAHTCAIRASAAGGKGTLWCWGAGAYGRLGNGGTENRPIPTQVFGDHPDWEQISAGDSHSCGLRASALGRELWCFGLGTSGQLGNGDTAQWLMPLLVAGGHTDWISVSSGGLYTVALRPGGAFAWGDNYYVQLGDGTAEKAQPFRVENPLLVE